MFTTMTTIIALAVSPYFVGDAGAAGFEPNCCAKNAYCCSVRLDCCPSAKEAAVSDEVALPSCCAKRAYCCNVKRACCRTAEAGQFAAANSAGDEIARQNCCLKRAYCCTPKQACCGAERGAV